MDLKIIWFFSTLTRPTSDDTETIVAWKSKVFSKASIRSPTTPGDCLPTKLKWIYNPKISVEFNDSCFKQDKATFTHRNIGNLFFVYELNTWSKNSNTDFTLGDCLFGVVKLTKNTHPNKYGYSGYGIGFDAHSGFSINGEFGKNIIISLWADYFNACW